LYSKIRAVRAEESDMELAAREVVGKHVERSLEL